MPTSLQDNGFCTQSEQFDFLLDMDGNRVKPNDEELYATVFYSKEDKIKQRDTVLVSGIPFTVWHVCERFTDKLGSCLFQTIIVSENDYARLKPFGKVDKSWFRPAFLLNIM